MFKRLWVARKPGLLLVAGGIVFIFLILAVGGVLFLNQPPSELSIEPVLKISYCGAEPQDLCVLSFGGDLEGKLIVNLFVPDRNFPNFYLKIKRLAGENVYECEKNKEVPTSVYCTGESINLKERIEISLISKEDDRLMATGKFVLMALLLSSQRAGGQVTEMTPIGNPEEEIESPPSPNNVTATPPPVSYPDSSYP